MINFYQDDDFAEGKSLPRVNRTIREKGERMPHVVAGAKDGRMKKRQFQTQWTHLRNQAARLGPRRSANKHAAKGKVTPG